MYSVELIDFRRMRRASYLSLVRRTLSTAMMAAAVLFMASCGDDPTTPEPTPTPTPTPTPDPGKKVSEVVKWMDERLQKEYMWLDEYKEKHSTFDRTLEWNEFLPKTLSLLTTNSDDGGVDDGKRSFYSYIHRTKSSSAVASTRALPTENGYGIEISSYVVGVSSIEGYEKGNYGFVIEHAYPGSAADAVGLNRGDLILQINGSKIDGSNYQELWMQLQDTESANSVKVTAEIYDEEAEEYRVEEYDLTASNFERNPVAYCDVLTVDEKYGAGDKKIGYMSYLAFDADFNDAMVDSMKELSKQGVTDMILDLRSNSGGHVISSVLLASMLLDESYVGDDKVYARLKHNPKNTVYEDEEITLEKKYTPSDSNAQYDLPNIGIKKLWVICSEFSASASEMVIVGLRGLDVEVELIGNVTEGKNCGMEVTYFTDEEYKYEFAPITFMNENGKGFSDYGDGIIPEHYLAAYASNSALSDRQRTLCNYFPVPLTAWDDITNDIALEETVMQICGKSLFTSSSSAQAFAPRRVATRAGGAALPERTNLKMERKDLRSRGLIVVKE